MLLYPQSQPTAETGEKAEEVPKAKLEIPTPNAALLHQSVNAAAASRVSWFLGLCACLYWGLLAQTFLVHILYDQDHVGALLLSMGNVLPNLFTQKFLPQNITDSAQQHNV